MRKVMTIIVLLFIGLFNQGSVLSMSKKLVYKFDHKLKETPIKSIPLELRYELSLLQRKIKVYDKIVKHKVNEDSIIVIPDTIKIKHEKLNNK